MIVHLEVDGSQLAFRRCEHGQKAVEVRSASYISRPQLRGLLPRGAREGKTSWLGALGNVRVLPGGECSKNRRCREVIAMETVAAGVVALIVLTIAGAVGK